MRRHAMAVCTLAAAISIPPMCTSAHAEDKAPPPSRTHVQMETPVSSMSALQKHYAKYPTPRLNPHLHASVTSLMSHVQPRDATDGRYMLADTPPRGLDGSIYTIRCALEEAAGMIEGDSGGCVALRELMPRLLGVAERLEAFQMRQRGHVSTVIDKYLPCDFRASVFAAVRQRSERTNRLAVEQLVINGGTIRDKYRLLWEQQWKRRESLAMLGNASGVWRFLVRYLAGVPASLLAIAKEINSPKGPTDGLRVKFGAALSQLTAFAIQVNACVATLVAAEEDVCSGVVVKQLVDCVGLYEVEVDKLTVLLEEVIVKSPFFAAVNEKEDECEDSDD